jgi:hypothetical protein
MISKLFSDKPVINTIIKPLRMKTTSEKVYMDEKRKIRIIINTLNHFWVTQNHPQYFNQ